MFRDVTRRAVAGPAIAACGGRLPRVLPPPVAIRL